MTGGIPGCEHLVEVGVDGDAVRLRAWQPAFTRDVTVFMLPGRRIEDLQADASRTAALAGHPNVVTVHDLGVTDEGIPYLVTELLEPGSLAEHRPLDWYEAASMTIKVAGVLESARKAGITGLAVTPADVYLSRFAEPKVAVLGRTTGATATPADDLRSLLRSVLATEGGPLQPVLDHAGRDVAGMADLLQRAQAAADRPVTQPAADRVVPAAPTAVPEDFSEVVTVVPGAPARRRRGGAWAAGAIVVLALPLATTALVDRRRQPPVPTTVPAASPTTVAAPVLYRADFTGPEWVTLTDERAKAGLVDGEWRYTASARGTWGAQLWRASGQRRISVSVAARMTPIPDARLNIYCGTPAASNRFLSGFVRPDGSWEISGNDRVLATGSAPERLAELQAAFVLRLDCVTNTTPTSAVLFLNDVPLGAGEGTGSYQLDRALVTAITARDEPFELSISAVTITGT